ncbi:hypothetical protein LOTGIDRAFT_174527 [Lottia gigantea]|uniref:RING-type E3 ubiquitin transferase BRCA1 n=1 Tax=Lottia gigantea TaxID=225164 RepID=V4AQT9_LOTGI|nr:hypothetical protein LOTGIDRAFT_174527 [Lottia gigantea]ESO97195.1 hypothetical protein LOTGIDRAFT_174527 [Lottia gigantea]
MTKNLECSICLELLKNPVSTKCEHQFCRFCIIQFLNKKRSVPCPLCKKPVTERSLQEREELAIIVQNIGDLIAAFQEDSGDIFTPPKGPLIQCFSPATPEPLNHTRLRSKTKSSKTTSRNQVSGRISSNFSLVPSESDNDDVSDLQRTVKTSTRRKSNQAQTELQNGVSKHDKGNTSSRVPHCGTPKEVPNLCASCIEPSQKYQRSGTDRTKFLASAPTRTSKPTNSATTERLLSCQKQQKVTTSPTSACLRLQKNHGLSVMESSNFNSKDSVHYAQDIGNDDANEIISLSGKHQNCKDLISNNINQSGTEKPLGVAKSARHTTAAKSNIRQSKRKSCVVTVSDELLIVLEDGSLGANTASTQSSFLHVTEDSNKKFINPEQVENIVSFKSSHMDSLLNNDFPARSSVMSKGAEEEPLDHCSFLEKHDDLDSRIYSVLKNSPMDSNESLSGIRTSTKTVENSTSLKVIMQDQAQSRKPILIECCPKSKNISSSKNLAKARQPKEKTRRRKIHSDSEEYEPSVTTDDDVIPETIQTGSQMHQTSQSSNVSYDVKFYDSPSKDPNRKKSRSAKQQSMRRMSDRLKKIQEKKDTGSPETSCLTQGGVKTPKLVTRTYGKICKGSLVKKTREDETWKQIVPSDEEAVPQESESCDSDVVDQIEDSNATTVEYHSSAFGFNTKNLAKDGVKNLQRKRPVNPNLADELHSKDVSTKPSVRQRMPRSPISPKRKASSASRMPTVQIDTSTPPRVISKSTPVSANGTPLKYGRGKLLPTPFNESLDTSLMSRSSGYIPKKTSHNRKVKVKMDAKGKLHMSLENRKSPRSNRNFIKPITNTADFITARIVKPTPSPNIIMDPFEFKSSQTPKDRKRKQVKQRKPAKKSNRLAMLGKKAALEILKENQKSSRESSKEKIRRFVTFAETQPVVIDITQDSTHSDSESILIEDSTSQDDQNQLELRHPQSIQKTEEPLDPMEDSNLPQCTTEASIKIIVNKPQSPLTTETDISCIADSVEEDEAGSSSEKQVIQETPVSDSPELCSGHVHGDSEKNTAEHMKSSSPRKQLVDSSNHSHIQVPRNMNLPSCSHTQELFSGTGKRGPYADSSGKTLTTPKMISSLNVTKEINQISSSPPIGDHSHGIPPESQTQKLNSKKVRDVVGSASKSQNKCIPTTKDCPEESMDNKPGDAIQPMSTSKGLQKSKGSTRLLVVSESRSSDSSSSTRPRRKRKSLDKLSNSDQKSIKTTKYQTEASTANVLTSLPCTKMSNGQPITSNDADLMPRTNTRDKTKAKHKAKRDRRKNPKKPENREHEMLQLMNKINNAEDHDFMFSTQEAYSSMDSQPAVNDTTIAGNHEIPNTISDIVENTEDNQVNAIEESHSDEEAVEDSVLIRRSDEDVDQTTVDANNDTSLGDENSILLNNNFRDSLELQQDSTNMNKEDEIEDVNGTHLHEDYEMDQSGPKGILTTKEGSPHKDEAQDSNRSSLFGPSADLISSLGKDKVSESTKEEFGNELVNEADFLFSGIGNATSKAEILNMDDQDPGFIRKPVKDLSTPLLYSPSQCKDGQSSSNRRGADNLRTSGTHTAPSPSDSNGNKQPNVGRTAVAEDALIKPSPSSSSKESKRDIRNVKKIPKKKKGRKTKSIQAILRSTDESDQSLNDSVQSLTCIPPTPMVERKLTQSQKELRRESDKLDDDWMETQDLTTAGDERSDDGHSSGFKLKKKLNKDRQVQNDEIASNPSGQTESASESLLKPDTKKLIDLAKPTQHQDSRKSHPSKECSNVGLERLSPGVPSDFSGSESSLLKRKRTFSSLKKQSRSGTPPSQNSCDSLAPDSKSQQSDLIIAETNVVGSSEDELNVRRKKRKCFSLEGSPMRVRSKNSQSHLSNQSSQTSQKSCGLMSLDQKNIEDVDGVSQMNDKNDTNQKENVRKKKSLFTKHSKNETSNSPKLQSSIDHSYEKRVTSKDRRKESSQLQVPCMPKEDSVQNLTMDGAKSQQNCPNDSEEDVIEILSSANPQRQTALENAETLPPSGLPMEWTKDDSSEDEVIQDTFENENTIQKTDVVGKKKSHLKDPMKKISDSNKENKFEDHDDEAVEDNHCGAGEDEKDSCNEVEDDQYADLPLTSSPVMATGRSVLSGLQPHEEEKSDSNVDEDDEDDDDEDDDGDVVRNVKRTSSAVIESDEDNLSDNESTNMNSSSAFSSQSEVTTQQRGAITSNILKMKQQIKQLEAELAVKGSDNVVNDSDSDSSDSDERDSLRISSKKKKQKEITTIRSSPEIENTKSDDSDSDLFLSPLQYSPPALESEEDHYQLPEVNREMSMPNLLNQLTEQQVDGAEDTDDEDELDDLSFKGKKQEMVASCKDTKVQDEDVDDDDDTNELVEQDEMDDISSKGHKQNLVPSRKDPMVQDDDDEPLPPTPQDVSKIQDKSTLQPSQNRKVTPNEQSDQMIDFVADSLPQTFKEVDLNQDSNQIQQHEEDPEPMSDEFDTCMESEEEVNQAGIPNSGDKNVKSSDEDVVDLPDEVKKAMEILQKYKSEVMNSQNSSSSKLSNKSTPISNNWKKRVTEKSPLVSSGKVSTPSRISLDQIDQTLRDVTPNRLARGRNGIENNSSDSTPVRRIPKFSSRKSTPFQSPRSSKDATPKDSKDATPSKNSSIIFERKVSQSTAGPKIESPRTPNNGSVIKRTPDSRVSKRVTTPKRQTTPGGKWSAESRRVLSMRTPNVPVCRNDNLKCNFAASGLSKDQAENVIKLAGLNDCKFYGKINKHITHLIVKTVSNESRVCERTLKFFQAIAHKLWILSYSWVEESLKAGHMVLENPYEILGDTVTGDSHYGPSLSRLSQDKLFQNLAVTCVGSSNDMSKADMVNLFESLGAEVVGDVDTLSCLRCNSQVKKLIVSNKDTMDTELPPEERNCYKNYYSTTGLVTVSREWVLDCISTYKLLPTKNYLFTPRPVRVPF